MSNNPVSTSILIFVQVLMLFYSFKKINRHKDEILRNFKVLDVGGADYVKIKGEGKREKYPHHLSDNLIWVLNNILII